MKTTILFLLTLAISLNSLFAQEEAEGDFSFPSLEGPYMGQKPPGKNAEPFASRFGWCVDYSRGRPLWKWIERIAGLAKKKIVWDPKLDSKNTETFAMSADGVDFNMWERQHPEFPVDAKAMSHKFRSCGAKCVIALL